LILLSALPMAGAILGAALDERINLGFTIWRTSCRAAGLNFASLASFTWQLLPWALTGLLAGGVGLLIYGAAQPRCCARQCLAAHAGCVLSLPLGILLCISATPVPVMLLLDVAAAALAAWLLLRTTSRSIPAHP
jgi:hypothetical protein